MWLHEHIVNESRHQLTVRDPAHAFEFEMWGAAPVQALGTVAGRDFYFRARHDQWTCEVADSHGRLPSDGNAASDGFFREGVVENASYMPFRQALTLIDKCMSEFFAAGL